MLEQAGLIEREVDAQWRRCRLKLKRLDEARGWLDHMRSFWEASLDRLEQFVTDEEESTTDEH